jgi:type I restriction enzyme S subunit
MGRQKMGWRRVKFGEVVRLGKERCTDPVADGIERYVGLEHIEPGDLRVRSWGAVSNGTTFTTRIRPGQVLFGKRRAYQRKVAVADFDGVCSGDIYVFESADPQRLLPALLPFICQTNAFFDHAVGTSAGSLSPRTNWTSLAEYEFALPPMDDQQRICVALQAAHTSAESSRALAGAAHMLFSATLASAYPGDRPTRALSQFCGETISRGIDQAGPNIPGGVPYIRVSDLTKGESIPVDGMLRTSPEIARRFASATVKTGEIVVALRGALGLPRIVPPELDGANLTQGTVRVSVREELSRDYVYFGLQSPTVKRTFRRYANGWKGESLREITLEAIREIPFPWAEPHDQRRIAEVAREAADAEGLAQSRFLETLALAHALNESITRGGV